MKIETCLAKENTQNIIRNLYPLYLYDLSEIYGIKPNQYGIFEEDETKTLEEQYHIQDIWFSHKDLLFPYIIFVDQNPAGFILVSTGKYAPPNTDYYVYEFFLLRPYRGKGIAEVAATQVFNQFRGKWELYTHHEESNIRAQKHWDKTINHYTSGDYTKEIGSTFMGRKLIFKFDNIKMKKGK